MNAVRESVNEVTDSEALGALDYIVVIDTSGSTGKGSLRLKGKSRLLEMKEEVQRVASEAGRFDSDGITVIQFASGTKTFDGVTADKVDTVFAEIHSGGSTNLAEAIRAITAKAKASTKDTVAFIFTDGEADDAADGGKDTIQAIKEAAAATKGRPKLGICIIQVGDDPSAASFLNKIDNDLGKYNVPDMIATVKEADSEGLTFGQLVWLAQNA